MFKTIINSILELLGKKLWAQFSQQASQNREKPRDGKPRKGAKGLHETLLQHLMQHYELRYNLLSEQAEFRLKGEDGEWRPVDQRAFNTLTMEAVDEGTGAWSLDMKRLLHSDWLTSYHPLRHYMERLSEWDGTDRLTPLAQRISSDSLWVKAFGIWLRALAAQWMGEERSTANALVPLLVSQEQGLRKSSFVRLLMPPQLLPYFTDKFDLTTMGNSEARLAKLGLISLDEFDRYTPRQMSILKNLLQLRQLSLRRHFTQQFVAQPRMASFIGTSNEMELLTDLTGSRRFLCMEVRECIDCSPLDHEQLFAQLRHEVKAGLPTHLSKTQERNVEEANRAFTQAAPAAEVFWKVFAQPQRQEEGTWLSATEIFMELQAHYPTALRGMHPNHFGRILRSLKLQMQHTAKANCYRVVRRHNEGGN